MPPGELRSIYTQNRAPLYASAVIGLGVLIGLIAVFWRRRKVDRGRDGAGRAPPQPAHVVALEALDALERSGFLESGRHLDYHMRLSEILREFVGRRYEINAMEMTTTEIKRAFDRRGLDKNGGVRADIESLLAVDGHGEVRQVHAAGRGQPTCPRGHPPAGAGDVGARDGAGDVGRRCARPLGWRRRASARPE